jgi:hypothetical protein
MAIVTKVVEQELPDRDSCDKAINEAVQERAVTGHQGVALSVSVSIWRQTRKNGDEPFVGKEHDTLPGDHSAAQRVAA